MEQVLNSSSQQLTKLRAVQPIAQSPARAVKPLHIEDDGSNLRQVLNTFRRRAWWLAGVTGTAAVSITAWNLNRPEVYQGKFRLLIESAPQNTDVTVSIGGKKLTQQQDNELDYETQIEVLTSEKILTPIVEKIRQKYPDIDYTKLVDSLQISRPENSKILEFSYRSDDPEEIKFVLSQLSQNYIQYSVENQQTNVKRAISFADQNIQKQQQQVKQLEAELEKFRRQNNLTDPALQTSALSEQMNSLLEKQRSNRAQLEAAQALYTNLQQQIGLSPQEAILIAALNEAPTYQQLLAQLRNIESEIATQSAVFTENAPEMQVLQDKRNQLVPLLQAEAQRILGRSGLAEKIDPQQIGFQGSITQDLIKQYAVTANQIQALQAQDRAITQMRSQLEQNIQAMAGISRQYGEIQRQLQAAMSSLDQLLTAQQNLELEAARQESSWELISNLEKPNITDISDSSRNLMLGLAGSMILGAGAALLAEKIDRSVSSIDDLKDSKLPCLGMVPHSSHLKESMLQLQNTHPEASMATSEATTENLEKRRKKSQHYYTPPFMEAFYGLEANLRLLDVDSSVQALTITSASPGDGKSTTAIHLALAAANMGRKVLLIDTDLRHPQIHKQFGTTNEPGLSNVLAGSTDLQQVIQSVPQDKNLYLLTAGTLPPAPGRLLASKKMRLLMEQVKQRFDLVILDTPPLLGFADAKLSAHYTDGILFVVKVGKTDRHILKHVLEDLNTANQTPVLGFVANGLKLKPSTTSSYNNNNYQNFYKQPLRHRSSI